MANAFTKDRSLGQPADIYVKDQEILSCQKGEVNLMRTLPALFDKRCVAGYSCGESAVGLGGSGRNGNRISTVPTRLCSGSRIASLSHAALAGASNR